VGLVLHKAILGRDYMKMALYGRPPEIGPLSESESRFQTFDWLPELVSQSAILWDLLALEFKHLAGGRVKINTPDQHDHICNPAAMTNEILGDTT
jgi:hypothetical protein